MPSPYFGVIQSHVFCLHTEKCKNWKFSMFSAVRQVTICISTTALWLYTITRKRVVNLIHVAAFFGHLQGDVLWKLVCWITLWIWPKDAETCRKFATHCTSLYLIIVRLLLYIWRHRHFLCSAEPLSPFFHSIILYLIKVQAVFCKNMRCSFHRFFLQILCWK